MRLRFNESVMAFNGSALSGLDSWLNRIEAEEKGKVGGDWTRKIAQDPSVPSIEMTELQTTVNKAKTVIDVRERTDVTRDDVISIGAVVKKCKEAELITKTGTIFIQTEGRAGDKITKVKLCSTKNFGIEGFSILGSLIRGCGRCEVRIQYCGVKAEELRSFQKAVDGSKITKLSFCANTKMGNDGFSALGDVIRGCDVEEVTLQDCNITAEGMKCLQKSVVGAKIRRLDVCWNDGMGEGGLSALGDVIRECEIDDVVMVDCNFKANEMKAFQESVAGAKIRKLDLSHNCLKDSFDSLANVIKQCQVDEILLWECQITDCHKQFLQKEAGSDVLIKP